MIKLNIMCQGTFIMKSGIQEFPESPGFRGWTESWNTMNDESKHQE